MSRYVYYTKFKDGRELVKMTGADTGPVLLPDPRSEYEQIKQLVEFHGVDTFCMAEIKGFFRVQDGQIVDKYEAWDA